MRILSVIVGFSFFISISKAHAAYEWYIGSWGACSAIACDTSGTQTRQVYCYDTIRDAPKRDRRCLLTSDQKPTETQVCYAKACSVSYTYFWQTSVWGACSATSCGTSGTQTRTSICKRSDGLTVANSYCTTARPVLSQSCSAAACSTPAACTLPWGGTIASGASVNAYLNASVASGSTCTVQTRVCSNGVLSGSYANQSCSVQAAPAPSIAANYFVRVDGGTAVQCNGKANAPYPGSGSGLACAWKNLAYAITYQQTPKLVSGDKLYIESGTYKIGFGTSGAETNPAQCDSSYTYDCLLSKIPSGVTIEGNCTNRPKLIGVERIGTILNLSNSSNTTLRCLEVTDNAECIDFHNTLNGFQKKVCNRDIYPHGEWASVGIYATDASNVLLDRVNIHGLAHSGFQGGRLSNWTFQDSNIDGNGWIGYDGDVGATTSSNSGTMKFLRTTIKWNGCIEMLNGTHQGCWAQVEGGYGDGLGTATTGGSWIFDGVTAEYNTSDGIDMLYVRNAGGNVTVRNSRAAHNAGNQIKTNQASLIENNVVVGDCAYHENLGTMDSGDFCRAMGNALSIGLNGTEVSTVRNNTITGEGDCLILTSGAGGTININNNIADGRTDWRQNFENTCFHYHDGTGLTRNLTSNVVNNVKEGCVAGQVCQNPMFVNPVFESFNPHLQSLSPASGYGSNLVGVPTN